MFTNKIVVVTGAASGIGFFQAQAFLKQGAIVHAIDKKINQELQSFDNCYFHQLDVNEIHHCQSLQEISKIDILCNTCGVLDDYLPLDQMSEELFDEIFQANVYSYMKMTKYALGRMLPYHKGIIINMASIAGLMPGGGGFAYTASKHAVVGMTKQLTYDYAHLGIRVNAIAPGAVKTAMTQADFENGGQIAKEIQNRIPIKRYADPLEIAELTLFLASDQASYLQGDVIPIDGGWMQRN